MFKKINFSFFRRSWSPEEVEKSIADRAARRAAKLAAKGKAASLLEDAREGYRPKSLAVRTVEGSGVILFVAALAIIAAGYLYDILFYGAQSSNVFIIIGLVIFAFVIRSLAAFGDVMLHWTKPDKDGETDDDQLQGLKQLSRRMVKNDADRNWLRVLWIMSIIACSFATVSFFSMGHESKQRAAQNIEATTGVIANTRQVRIDALEQQKGEAATARDAAIAAADATIKGVEDEFGGVNTQDNITIRDANASKNTALATYNRTVADLNKQINDINAETGLRQEGQQEQKNESAPMQSVYVFLARGPGTAEQWAIAGAWFFAILFELLIAKLLAIVSVLNKVMKRIAKGIQMREAADEMHARLAIQKMRSNIDLEDIRLKAAAAKERALADIDLAQQEREVQKAQAQAEALRDGRVWIDPDEMLQVKAELEKAENHARMQKMKDRTERILSGDLDPDEDEMTDAQRRAQKAGQAAGAARNRDKIPIGDTDPFETIGGAPNGQDHWN